MAFELPPLPWASDALDPYISANLMGFHYGKHHQGYVTKLNAAVAGTPWADKSLEEVIKSGDKQFFNNAAQIWNHTFFWNSMRPKGGGEPTGKLMDKIGETFGGYDKFKEEFSAKAGSLFGSGWTWLAKSGDKLEIIQTQNADTPITEGKTPLITIDVWEHAYYLDYQNRRPDFIKAFMDNLVNWDFAAENFEK